MNTDKAQQIINDALSSPETYKAMAEQESKVWSKHFTNPDHINVREKEKSASQVLGGNQKQLSLAAVLAELGLNPIDGVSLGCGSGRAERMLLNQGVCQNFLGIDIADNAVEEASNLAKKEGLACRYEVQDLNALHLPPNSFDLVVAQTSLHHVLRLEHVFDQVKKALRPGGVFWVHDYVGESQFQFSDERLKIMNDIFRLLPDHLRVNHFTKKTIAKIIRREPGQLISPFESIRSGEIKPLLLEHFDVLVAHESSTFMSRVVGLGMLQNYSKDENTIALYRTLRYFDQLLADMNILPAHQGQYLLKAKPS